MKDICLKPVATGALRLGRSLDPVEYKHVVALDQLPFHHKDPFDRLIIAQAIAEDFTLVSADSKFSAYTVKLLK